jgi:hypothetical protein
MTRSGIDLLAFSGHKLYAPFGAGALVGRMAAAEPLLRGGGAIKLVTLDEVIWADAPDRYEAGSPNVIGAVAFAAACVALEQIGMATLADRERALSARLDAGLDAVPGLTRLALWPVHVEHVGVASFTLAGPKAHDLPIFKVGLTETKSPSNPLGLKGCGEAGAIAAPAAVINAITDAVGTENITMPATANSVWSALSRVHARQAAE